VVPRYPLAVLVDPDELVAAPVSVDAEGLPH
jgi:hypothetical protein